MADPNYYHKKSWFTAVADQARRLGQIEDNLTPEEMVETLESVEPGGGAAAPALQDKTITENGTYTADDGYDGLGTVTVNTPTADSCMSLSSNASGRIPEYDHGYATSTLTLDGLFESTAN